MSPSNHTIITRRIPLVARRAVLAGAALLIGGGLAAGCGSETGSDAHDIGDKAAIQAKMDRLVSLGVPGITVLVRDGNRSLQLTSGVSDLKTGDRRRCRRPVTEIYPYYWGAGNLVADADDIAVFYKALMRAEFVSAASLREMKTVVAQTPDRGQGLGLVSGRNRCGRFYGHDGSVPGYFSDALVMNSGRQVVFLVNSVSIQDDVANPKAQKVLGELVETAACSA